MPDRRVAIRNVILIICGAACVYLAGNGSVSLWDRDEPRYAQTSRQMLKSGDWVVPRLLDEPREKKPVFIYWCQSSAMAVLGDSVFAARLPSVMFVTLTLVMLATVLARTVGPRRGFWTTFIFATSGLTLAAAKMCITDGVLIFFVTAGQLCLATMLLGNHRWFVVIACGIAVGFALLTKGPVVLGVMLTTLLALGALHWITRRNRKLPLLREHPSRLSVTIAKWAIGIALALLILAPWLYFIEQRLPGYTLRTLREEVLNRAAKPMEGHKGPPGYYLLLIWVTYFPWSLLLPATIISAWKHRHLPHIRIALAAIIGPWIMFEIVQTKLLHYVLPIFPPLAFLTADMLIRAARKKHFADPIFLKILLGWGALLVLVSLAPWASLIFFEAPNTIAVVIMLLLPLLAFEYGRSVYVHFRAKRPLDAAIAMGVGMMILIVVIYAGYFPNAPFLRISNQVAEVLIDQGATRAGDAIMIDYKETSLAFYQGGTIRPKDDNYFAVVPPLEWPRWVVVTDSAWKKMPETVHQSFELVQTVRGVNYAGGDVDKKRLIDVLVLRKRAGAAFP